jgi:hypothetical protein
MNVGFLNNYKHELRNKFLANDLYQVFDIQYEEEIEQCILLITDEREINEEFIKSILYHSNTFKILLIISDKYNETWYRNIEEIIDKNKTYFDVDLVNVITTDRTIISTNFRTKVLLEQIFNRINFS